MARNSNVSQEVADELADAVREVRRLVFGGAGIPAWGTKFAKIEAEGMAVGAEFARLFMEQSVEEQAEHVPLEAFDSDGEASGLVGEARKTLTTGVGNVEWDQPASYLKKSRRAFFPSGEGLGD